LVDVALVQLSAMQLGIQSWLHALLVEVRLQLQTKR